MGQAERPWRVNPPAGGGALEIRGDGLAFGDGENGFALGSARVLAEGAEEAIIGELFEDVGGPAAHPRDGEDGGEEIGGDAEGIVDGSAIEIDIGVEAFLFLHDGGDAFAHLDPFGVTEFVAELDGHGFEVGGARVEDFVDAVSDAHDFFLLGEGVIDPLVDLIEGADFLEHVNDAFVGAAVEGAFEGTDGGADGGIHIAEGAGDHATGESAGVEAVFGVEDVGDVESLDGFGAWFLAGHEPEEVGGFAEIFANGGEGLAGPGAMKISGDDADLGDEFDGNGLAIRHFEIVPTSGVAAEHADGGAHDIDGGGGFGGGDDEIDYALGKFAFGAESGGEFFEFAGGGESIMPEEMNDFLVGDFSC